MGTKAASASQVRCAPGLCCRGHGPQRGTDSRDSWQALELRDREGRGAHPHLASHWSLDAPDAHLNARGSEDPFLYPALGPRFEHANEPACERTLPRPFGPHCFGGESGHRHPLSILILSPGRLSWLRLPSSSGWEPRPRQGPTGSQRARNSPKQDGCH